VHLRIDPRALFGGELLEGRVDLRELASLTESVATPILSSAPSSTNLPVTTPIEPVMVPGCATITCAGTAM